MRVILTYYRLDGTYYYEGEYETRSFYPQHIRAEVVQMMRERRLPSLVRGHGEYIVLVKILDNAKGYSCLCLPSSILADLIYADAK